MKEKYFHSEETKKKIGEKSKNRKCSLETKLKISKKMKGRKLPPRTETHCKNLSISGKGKCKPPFSSETRNKLSLSAKRRWADPNNFLNSKEYRKYLRQRMLDGFGAYVSSFNKNPSKPQVELYSRIKKIFPTAILNYVFFDLNLTADIIILEHKIIIESDGEYWHQDKEKDLIRQKKIEYKGFTFIRYIINCVSEVPSIDKIKEDISHCIEENEKVVCVGQNGS